MGWTSNVYCLNRCLLGASPLNYDTAHQHVDNTEICPQIVDSTWVAAGWLAMSYILPLIFVREMLISLRPALTCPRRR
jgi:hypothetical protein